MEASSICTINVTTHVDCATLPIFQTIRRGIFINPSSRYQPSIRTLCVSQDLEILSSSKVISLPQWMWKWMQKHKKSESGPLHALFMYESCKEPPKMIVNSGMQTVLPPRMLLRHCQTMPHDKMHSKRTRSHYRFLQGLPRKLHTSQLQSPKKPPLL